MRIRRRLMRKTLKNGRVFLQRNYARITYNDHIKAAFKTTILKELRRVPIFWRWRRPREFS